MLLHHCRQLIHSSKVCYGRESIVLYLIQSTMQVHLLLETNVLRVGHPDRIGVGHPDRILNENA